MNVIKAVYSKRKKVMKMIEGAFFILAVFAITASIFFGAGVLVGHAMECKEAYDFIEHVFEVEDHAK